jgi:hypothetical protein
MGPEGGYKMGAIYVLNSLIVPFKGNKAQFTITKIDLSKAKEILQSYVSAVGHAGTAQLISQLVGKNIPMNRISIYFDIGDEAVAFVPQERLPEGVVLDAEALAKININIYHIIRVA